MFLLRFSEWFFLYSNSTESEYVNVSGAFNESESMIGLLKRLQIRAHVWLRTQEPILHRGFLRFIVLA